MTPPHSRDERLNELVSIVNGIRWGMPGYDQRLVELSAGFRAGIGGGTAKGDHADPTCDQAAAIIEKNRKDPAKDAQDQFDKRLLAAERAFSDLWDVYSAVAHVRLGVSRVEDPGCELCNEVPDHWCMTDTTIEVTSPPKRKGQPPTVRKLRLCSWCYQFQRPDRAGRRPEYHEVERHARGLRVRWKVGA